MQLELVLHSRALAVTGWFAFTGTGRIELVLAGTL